MNSQNPNRIAELRLAKRWNQRELADAIGVHYMTISKLERGEMKLTQDWMERLAPHLGVSAPEILADSSLKRMVYVEGRLTSDGRYVEEESSLPLPPVEFEVDLGVTPPDTSLWFFVDRPFFGPISQHGSLARFTFFDGTRLEDFIDHVCYLDKPSGAGSLVGLVHRGKDASQYDLTLPNGARAKNVKAAKFAVLTLLLPIPLFIPENFDGSHDWPNP